LTELSVAELAKVGQVSRTALYNASKGGKLTIKDGKIILESARTEWESKRDRRQQDAIGPAITRALEARGVRAGAPSKEPKAGSAPTHLSAEARGFWNLIMQEYDLEPDARFLLRAACENWDRAQQAREMIARDGLVMDGKRHPAVDVEKQAYGLFLRAVRQLGLDVVAAGPTGRPPGR
jgi:hypothetical protein